MLPFICSIESHSSENSHTLIGYLSEVFSMELPLLKAKHMEYCNIHTDVNEMGISFI